MGDLVENQNMRNEENKSSIISQETVIIFNTFRKKT